MRLAVVIATFFLCNYCKAQSPPHIQRTSIGVSQDGYFRVGPDPKSDWELLKFASEEPDVASYLGISKQMIDQVTQHFAAGEADQVKIFRELKAQGRSEEITEKIIQYRQDFLRDSDEILTPEQMDKLRQVALRVEVIRIGLPDALVRGRLAETVGTYEGQKSDLYRKAKQIEKETQLKITELLRQSESETLALLTPEQRQKAEEALGETHDYVETSRVRKMFQNVLESKGDDLSFPKDDNEKGK